MALLNKYNNKRINEVMCMIKIITGQTGEGKTKKMVEAANNKLPELKGSAVYIDTSNHLRYALSHKIRLIEAASLPLKSRSSFIGFLCGLISSNHDIEVVFIDELFKLTHCNLEEMANLFEELQKLSDEHHVEFFIGTSCSKTDLPQHLTPYLIA